MKGLVPDIWRYINVSNNNNYYYVGTGFTSLLTEVVHFFLMRVTLTETSLPPVSSDYISTPWQIDPHRQSLLITYIPTGRSTLAAGSSDYISTPWQIDPHRQGLLTT